MWRTFTLWLSALAQTVQFVISYGSFSFVDGSSPPAGWPAENRAGPGPLFYT